MSKDDVETPQRPPSKRRQLQSADVLDTWLAVWATDDNLTPSERRRAQDERDRRKAARRREDAIVGVIVGPEGATPAQSAYITGYLLTLPATGVCHAGVSRGIARAFPPGVAEIGAPDWQAVVRVADVILAAPKEQSEPVQKLGVWSAIRYARHRNVPVRIVLPNGEERT